MLHAIAFASDAPKDPGISGKTSPQPSPVLTVLASPSGSGNNKVPLLTGLGALAQLALDGTRGDSAHNIHVMSSGDSSVSNSTRGEATTATGSNSSSSTVQSESKKSGSSGAVSVLVRRNTPPPHPTIETNDSAPADRSPSQIRVPTIREPEGCCCCLFYYLFCCCCCPAKQNVPQTPVSSLSQRYARGDSVFHTPDKAPRKASPKKDSMPKMPGVHLTSVSSAESIASDASGCNSKYGRPDLQRTDSSSHRGSGDPSRTYDGPAGRNDDADVL